MEEGIRYGGLTDRWKMMDALVFRSEPAIPELTWV
jgi:hypothetical protein